MAGKLQFGIYWGKNGFGLVETRDKQILNYAYTPFDTPLGTENDGTVPDELRYGALIQKAVQANNIQGKQVNIALSDKDFIFRSFVIPWMQAHEVKNVVDFEATKYIPIPLENLTYAFHAETITENNRKNLLILFFAVRKDITQQYTQVLGNFGLEVIHIEPSPVSLVRVFQKQGILTKNQSHAIVIIAHGEGKIIILERDAVQFVRDFPVPEKPGEITSDSTKIFNNIRVSFNFYYRQNPKGKIDNIVFLTLQECPQFIEAVAKEFDKTVLPLVPFQIIGKKDVAHIDILNAYGAALREKTVSSKNFELGEKAKSLQKAGETAMNKLRRYKVMGAVVAICLLFIFMTNFFSNHFVVGHRRQLKALEDQQGNFRSLKTEEIREKNKTLSSKLTAYGDIRLKSNLRYYLSFIPGILPPGVWLSKFSVQYRQYTVREGSDQRSVSKPNILLEGYAYHRDLNEQFRVVSNLVGLLKSEPEFSQTFDSIDRESMQQGTFNNYLVTSFRIICK